MRKIVQISTSSMFIGEVGYSVLVVLCDDNTLWEKSATATTGWKQMDTEFLNGIKCEEIDQ